jgi:hypothetical protein
LILGFLLFSTFCRKAQYFVVKGQVSDLSLFDEFGNLRNGWCSKNDNAQTDFRIQNLKQIS